MDWEVIPFLFFFNYTKGEIDMNKKKLLGYLGKVIYEGVVAVCIAAAIDTIVQGIEAKGGDNDETTI